MPILNFKPNTLQTLMQSGGYEDENGDYHKGEETWTDYCRCDAVPSGKAGKITLPDGSTYQYMFSLTLPKSVRDFSYGERIRIVFGKMADASLNLFAMENEDGVFTIGVGSNTGIIKVLAGANGRRMIEASVRGFHRYQHQCKIWL